MPRARYDERGRPTFPITLRYHPAYRGRKAREGVRVGDIVSGFALLDTGADTTVIDATTALNADLVSVDSIPFLRYDSHKNINSPSFEVEMVLDGMGSWPLRAASLDLARFHLIAVIGRDILNDLVLTYDGPARTVSLERP